MIVAEPRIEKPFWQGMMGRLPAWIAPPAFADAAKTRAARTLHVLTVGLAVMGAISMLLEWSHHWKGAAYTLAVENLCLVAAFWFNRRGETEWATKIICFSELACAVLLITRYGVGLRDEEVLLFPLMLVTAAVLLNWRAYLTFAAVVVLALVGAGFVLEETGNPTSLPKVLNSANILLTTVVAAGLLARNLKKSVIQAEETERELKALSARLIDAQEAERSRLARELHDDLAQQIAALSISLSNLRRKLPAQDTEARSQSERMQQKLEDLSESIRRLSHELHPAVLEALQNVAKHAHVEEASVDLRRSGSLVSLVVSDRGDGVAPGASEKARGLGLASIKERARLVNGSFEMKSSPGRGTVLRVRIPLS
jgi:two-component system sensor histidine kinase UhpB